MFVYRNFVKMFNYTEISMKDESSFGIWNGKEFVFKLKENK